MQEKRSTLQSPWVSIWTQPRATIQAIVDTDPTHKVLLLAALSGIAGAISPDSEIDYNLINILLASAFGAVFGIIGLYMGSVLLCWTGRWISGQGTRETIRCALAWSSIPNIFAIVLWLPAMLFLDGLNSGDVSLPQLLVIIFQLWSFVLSLKCLGQVQGFSAWRALWNLLLPSLVIFLPLGLLLVIFVGIQQG